MPTEGNSEFWTRFATCAKGFKQRHSHARSSGVCEIHLFWMFCSYLTLMLALFHLSTTRYLDFCNTLLTDPASRGELPFRSPLYSGSGDRRLEIERKRDRTFKGYRLFFPSITNEFLKDVECACLAA